MAPQKRDHTVLKVILTVIILTLVAGSAWLLKLSVDLVSTPADPQATESILSSLLGGEQGEETPDASNASDASDAADESDETGEPDKDKGSLFGDNADTQPTEPPQPVTASISAQGDLLIHGGIIKSCNLEGGYDFESNFRYLAPYLENYDYSIANLETTFGGDASPYQGWPMFNVPDAFGDAVVDAGFEMLLTANNHCYDTLEAGLLRTLEVAREKGLETLGTRLDGDEPRYSIVDINGIRVGMVSYTYTTSMSNGKPSLNGNTPVQNDHLVNYFHYNALGTFYSQLEDVLLQMESEGVDTTMVFIHWGEEYQITENNYQNTIAQKICDLGVDVIVGGHPHVVQPMELLTSAVDPEHKTVCIYSLGNAISNQRISEMRLKTGHTEDGVLFSVTFERDPESGDVSLSAVDVMPTWVALDSRNGKLEYNILPLEDADRDQWKEMFNLDDATFDQCVASYDRTMALVGPGLEQVNTWLASK